MKVSFDNSFKRKSVERFDKLKVEKGETDRVGIITAPDRFYVHTLNMPVIDPATGEVVMETRQNARGESYEVESTEFVGSYLCNGDQEKIADGADGFDPDNCALCAAIKEHGDKKFRRPEPKYACYVIKYKLNSRGEPQLDPFQAELFLWVYTQNRFEKIIAVANEHGDPLKLDLLLGPCKNAQFQAYEIGAGGKCYWREDKDRQKYVASLIKSTGIGTEENDEVVRNTVGRKMTETSVEMDINKVLERHAAIGKPASGGTATQMDFGGNSGWNTNPEKTEKPDFAQEDTSSKPPAWGGVDDDSSEGSDDEGNDDLDDFDAIMAQLNGDK